MNKNNLIFFFSFIIAVSTITLFLNWYEFKSAFGPFEELTFTTTGLNGKLHFFNISLPHWLLVSITIGSSLISILNIKKIIKIYRLIPIIMNVIVMLWLLGGIYALFSNAGTLQLGIILITISAFSSLGLQLSTLRKR